MNCVKTSSVGKTTMALKRLNAKDRLYYELRAVQRHLGKLLDEFEAMTATEDDQGEQGRVGVIDPRTNKPLKPRATCKGSRK